MFLTHDTTERKTEGTQYLEAREEHIIMLLKDIWTYVRIGMVYSAMAQNAGKCD